MTRTANYEELPQREKISKPRGAKHPSGGRNDSMVWDTERSKKKSIDRSSKVRYYADIED